MANNNIIRFADPANSGANVTSQASYIAKTALINQGFQAGIASSADFNKLAAQLSSVVTAVAQMIVDHQAGVDVNDTDTTAMLEAHLIQAIQAIILAYGYAPLASPNFSGTPTVPTVASSSDSTTKSANTAFVQNAIAGKANINSPTFTGTPAASTPANGDNSSTLSTTGSSTMRLQPGPAMTQNSNHWICLALMPPPAQVSYGLRTGITGLSSGTTALTCGFC
jgi:hypothetical protein